MELFQTEPLNLTRIHRIESAESPRDLCLDCNSEYCIVKKLHEYEEKRFVRRVHECELCRKSYTSLTTLRIHQRAHVDNKSFRCEYCAKLFDGEHMLATHLIHHQCQHTKVKPVCKPVECNLCHKRFSRQSSLSAHNRLHRTPEPNFPCSVCGRSFRWKSNLNAHRQLHEIQKFICKLCQKIFKSLDRMQQHREMHANPEKQCRYCEKAFSTRYKVNSHIRLKHHNIAPWQCQLCVESFATAITYRSHLYESHDIAKPFACRRCDRTFLTAHNLNTHMLKHRKVDRFECDYCGHQFKYKRNLYIHMKRHKPSYTTETLGDTNKKRTTRTTTIDPARYFKPKNNCEVGHQKATFNCTHDSRYLPNQINNGLNNVNIDTDAAAEHQSEERMSVKIGWVTENRANQIIPLYELNIPAMDSTSTGIDAQNAKPTTLNVKRQDIEPVILVQAFTTSLNETTDNSIIKPNVTVCNHQTDSFKAFCDSLTPKTIVIDDSSSSSNDDTEG